MNTLDELPKIEKKEKINSRKFELLAKRVRQYFEEEAKYLSNQTTVYGNNKTTKLIFPS